MTILGLCCAHGAGHRKLLQVAKIMHGDKEAAYELSLGNPDKVSDIRGLEARLTL